MIVSSRGGDSFNGSFMRGNFCAEMKENGSYVDIFFNYCGEDIWIAIPKEDLKNISAKTTVTYDFPLNSDTLLKKIRKLKSFDEL
jgi:hypothetical protein